MTVQQADAAAETAAAGRVLLSHRGVTYRRPDPSAGDYPAIVALQGEIWDESATTPAHHLIATQTCGGVVVTAAQGARTVGFSYGFPAYLQGRHWLHSHQTGVHPGCRDAGVGAVLKWLQRALALRAGHRTITWTFDPLQSRNAHLNFSKLGATADTYKPDYYGELGDRINRGLATDRLWVQWRLDEPAVARRFGDFRLASGLLAFPDGGGRTDEPVAALRDPLAAVPRRPEPLDLIRTAVGGHGARLPVEVLDRPASGCLRVELPADLDDVVARAGHEGSGSWRRAVREALTAAFADGYAITGHRTARLGGERRSWYVLTRPSERDHGPVAGGH